MQRQSVRSSNLASVGYEASTSTLEIEFLDGRIYHYFHVPEAVHRGLMGANSHGIFLNTQVKEAGYSCKRIR